MDIGPLEYAVIGVSDLQRTNALISEMNAIQAAGQVRVVDLVFVEKAADGTLVTKEASDLSEAELARYGGITGNLMGLLTAQDVEQLAEPIPSETSALIVLFEHTWVIGLTEAVRQGGAVVFSGGMVSQEALAQVSAELSAANGGQDA